MHWAYRTGLSALTVAVVVSGCGDESTRDGTPTTADAATATTSAIATSPTAASPAPAPAGRGVPVAEIQQALRTAAQAVPNGRAFDIEVDHRGDQRVFEVDVAADGNETQVVVGADGTQVVSQEQRSRPGDDVVKAQNAQVDAARAIQAAADHEPDTTFSELDIDTNRDGVVVWQVELVRADGAEVEVSIDAQSGAVVTGR